jgi:CelD/BcsL family acetyltransferase involved in cellulose biosynthesis
VAADVSAGELLFYLMIEQASSSGHKVFDFGVGDQLYKRSWCPQRTELVDCYVPLNLKGRLAAPLITGMIRLKRDHQDVTGSAPDCRAPEGLDGAERKTGRRHRLIAGQRDRSEQAYWFTRLNCGFRAG